MPAFQLARGMRGERSQCKTQVLVDIERARDVLPVVGAVLRLVGFAIEHPMVDEELAPLVIAVAAEQRVVEVEECQAHAGARSLTAM